jgi:hypothetical protein
MAAAVQMRGVYRVHYSSSEILLSMVGLILGPVMFVFCHVCDGANGHGCEAMLIGFQLIVILWLPSLW